MARFFFSLQFRIKYVPLLIINCTCVYYSRSYGTYQNIEPIKSLPTIWRVLWAAMYILRSKPISFWKSFLTLIFFINYHNIEPIKFDILTDYLTVFVDCHDAPLGRAAHSARHAAALSCHRRDCFHLRVGNEKMWELDMILRLKSCNWHSVDKKSFDVSGNIENNKQSHQLWTPIMSLIQLLFFMNCSNMYFQLMLSFVM